MTAGWERVCNAVETFVGAHPSTCCAVGLLNQRDGSRYGFQAGVGDDSPALYLIASLTKPIYSTLVMQLVERGEVSLTDRVTRFLPEFKSHGKHVITLHHLLSHTSGLPDTLPDDKELRAQNAELAIFLEQTCRQELLFTPGSTSRYASMGFVVLGEIIERLTGEKPARLLDQELLRPLQMRQTWLGLPMRDQKCGQRIVRVDTTPQQVAPSGDWNSDYWHRLGAPWGGMISTVPDLLNFCEMILAGGVFRNQRLISQASLEMMLGNRLLDYPQIAITEQQSKPWGLGWRLNWTNHRTTFGDLLPSSVAGHWGATGTLMWVDRDKGLAGVILGNFPVFEDYSPLICLSNVLRASVP